jgi:N6-adenosine-specific RNA methylase IME4
MSGVVLTAVQLAAAAALAWMGYGFGIQIGGAPMGFIAAANCALFAWLMVPALAEQAQRLARWRRWRA